MCIIFCKLFESCVEMITYVLRDLLLYETIFRVLLHQETNPGIVCQQIVFYVFNPALVSSNLASTITVESMIEL